MARRGHRSALGSRTRAGLLGALGAALGLALSLAGSALLGGPARADGDPSSETVPRVIPYRGTLRTGSTVYTGEAELRFTLRDATDVIRWSEERSSSTLGPVVVDEGRFGVELGAVVPIEATLRAADALRLGIEVRAPWSDEWVALDGEQALAPVLWALWTASATDFDVAGALSVAGTTTLSGGGFRVDGAATLGTLDVGGALRVDGAILGSEDTVPEAALAWFGGPSCPDGWQPYGPARGRVLVGANTGGARGLSATVGTALGEGSVPNHRHTVSFSGNSSEAGAHTHTYDPPSTTSSTVSGNHGEALIGQNDGAIDSPHAHTVDIGVVTSGSAGGHAHIISVPNAESSLTATIPQIRFWVCERVP